MGSRLIRNRSNDQPSISVWHVPPWNILFPRVRFAVLIIPNLRAENRDHNQNFRPCRVIVRRGPARSNRTLYFPRRFWILGDVNISLPLRWM